MQTYFHAIVRGKRIPETDARLAAIGAIPDREVEGGTHRGYGSALPTNFTYSVIVPAASAEDAVARLATTGLSFDAKSVVFATRAAA